MTDAPRIYVASLSDYNAGTLHGVWIDATLDPDEIFACITDMLAASPEAESFPLGGPAEEWAIHDYEGFGGFSLSEYADLHKVSDLANLLNEHGQAYSAYAEYVGIDNATADGFKDAYCGEWESHADYAQEWFYDVCGKAVEDASTAGLHVDWDGTADELFMGDFTSVDRPGGIYVFRAT